MDNLHSPGGGYNSGGYDNGYLGSGNQGYYSGGQGGYNQSYGQGGYNGGYGQGYGQGGYNNGYSQGGGFYPGSGGFYPGGNQGQGGYAQGGYNGGYQQGAPYTSPYMQQGYNSPRYGNGGGSFVRRNLLAIPNNAINYIIFLPFLGLFLENFAVSLPLGVLLWGLVIIFMRIAAYNDAKEAIDKNILADSAKTVALISPVVYIFMRCRALSRGMGRFIFVCFAVAAAVFTNGFVRSMTMKPQSFVEYAQTRYLTEVGIFDKIDDPNENYVLSDRADIFIDKQDWSYSEFKGKKCVILTGMINSSAPEEYRNKEIEIKIETNFDGYNIKTMRFDMDECSLDDEELEEDESEKLVKGLFHDWSAPEGSSDSSDDSSDKNNDIFENKK